MQFIVSKEIFDKFPDFCVAVVVAEGINNKDNVEETKNLLQESVQNAHNKLQEENLKEKAEIAAWREAFRDLNINPNKYPSSIEALLKRVSKKPEFPSINNTVDLVNTVAIKHCVPMGAHDLDKMKGDIYIRFSQEGDVFTPFGSDEQEDEQEQVPPGEPVYADEMEVRTRLWIWRQGEKAKITTDSTKIFFPIDGFKDVTQQQILAAREELREKLQHCLEAHCRTYFIDAQNPAIQING